VAVGDQGQFPVLSSRFSVKALGSQLSVKATADAFLAALIGCDRPIIGHMVSDKRAT
jgi:hypothetical protein